MKNGYKKIMAALLASAMAVTTCIPAFAASHKISSVNIKIKAEDLEIGEEMPELDYGDSSSDYNEGVYVYSTSSRYRIVDVDWITSESRILRVGDQPRLEVWLTPDDDDYYFRGTYNSSNITISGGSLIDAEKDDGDLILTIKLDPVEGTYDEPDDAYWEPNMLGRAKWEPGESESDYYDVYLYREGTIVTKVEELRATSYDFYPYMTKEGDYSFKVRAVPDRSANKRYGKSSEWAESEEQYISPDRVSDGSGQGSGNTGSSSSGYNGQVGWIKDGTGWYFRYPDGTYEKDGWMKWNDRWYYFDSSGYMLKGWQTSKGIWYYLNPSQNEQGPEGAMLTGWVNDGGKVYYMNPDPNGPEGALVTGWVTGGDGKKYYMDPSGARVSGWYKIGDGYYYFYPEDGSMAVNTTIDSFVLGPDGVWKKN